MLQGGVSYNLTQNWDKNGKIYYTDENGNIVKPDISPLNRFGRVFKAFGTNAKNWLNETNPESEMYKQKVNTILALETAPLGIGKTATSGLVNLLKPLTGNKIGKVTAQGIGGGLVGSGVEGFGSGLIEGENPFKRAASNMVIGGALGGLGGLALGKIGQQLAKKNLHGDKLAQENYFNDYIADLTNKTKPMAEFRGLREGVKGGGTGTLFDSSNPLHVKQAELINKYNPAQDDYHTWIRTADDIKTFEDTLKDTAYIDGGDFDPSYSRDMALQAIKDGEIDVYSSYPIDKGIFVSPSYMEAEQYAGGLGGKVYSKRVPLSDVAWIDPTQGQYAPIRELPKPVIKEEIKPTAPIPPYKESNFYKQRMQRRLARQLSEEDSSLYNKIINISKELKAPKPIEKSLKKEGEIVIMEGSEPYKKGEQERVLSAASAKYTKDGQLKSNITEEIFDEEDKKYYLHKIYTKDGKTKMKKQVSKDETIFD